jgi:hypothetical protein
VVVEKKVLVTKEVPVEKEVPKDENDENVNLLARFIDNQIALKGQNTNADLAAPYSKLLAYATPSEMAMFYVGHVCAIIGGFALPSFSYLMGDVLDAFGGTSREA